MFFHNLHIINAGPWKSHIGPKRFLGYPMELPPLDGRRSLATGVYIGLCVVPPAKEKGVKSEPWGEYLAPMFDDLPFGYSTVSHGKWPIYRWFTY
jgi:hypothetical protein